MKKLNIAINISADIREDVQKEIEEKVTDKEIYKDEVIGYACERLNELLKDLLPEDEFEGIEKDIKVELE